MLVACPNVRGFKPLKTAGPALPFHKLWKILTPYEHKRAVALLALMFIGMVFETLGVGLVLPIIQIISRRDYDTAVPALLPIFQVMGGDSHETVVMAAVLVIVTVYVLKNIFLAFLSWRQMRFAFGLQADISQRLFATYLRQPYTFHLQRNSAELIRNIIVEVAQFNSSCVLPALILVTEILVLIGLFTLLLILEPLGAVVVVVVTGAAGWLFHRLTKGYLTRWGLARQAHEGFRIQQLQEGLGGVKDAILLGREQDFLDQYAIHNNRTAKVWQRQKTLQQIPRLWFEVLAVITLSTLVLTMLAQGRDFSVIVPTLGMFGAAAFRILPSANRILSAMQSLRYGMPATDMLYTELNLSHNVRQFNASNATVFTRSIMIDHVCYAYPNAGRLALDDLTISIGCGESIGIIGSSGAGKSTFVDVLLGLISPDRGQVCVDGTNIQKNLRDWQNQIGYVPQSIFLTDDTLRRNIAFGIPADQIDDDAIWQAIRAAQLEVMVNALPHGLETLVGERGVRLSGGQRQRIGIARALYHDPVVLVLDEATSSLDTATENELMSAVRSLQNRSKTIIIVAHRLSTVEYCDRIYRIEKGRVVQEGTYADVVLPKG